VVERGLEARGYVLILCTRPLGNSPCSPRLGADNSNIIRGPNAG